MKFCKDCWNFSRCNAEGRTADFAVDDGVCREFDEVKNMTNADRIRAMSDEELAVALANSVIDVLLMAHDMSDEQEKVPKYLRDSLTQNYLKWLREPAEGE